MPRSRRGSGRRRNGRRQAQVWQRQPGEVVGGAVVLGDRQVVGKALEIPHDSSFAAGGRPVPWAGWTTHAAFLRGMNLGGRRITNKDLAAAVSGIGFEEVDTFRASGNVVFAAEEGTESKVCRPTRKGPRGLARVRGAGLPSQLRRRSGRSPPRKPFKPTQLDGVEGQAPGRVAAEEAAGARHGARRSPSPPMTTCSRSRARELYWLPSGGISDSELDLEGRRGRARPDHDPDDGHGRADRGQVLRLAGG